MKKFSSYFFTILLSGIVCIRFAYAGPADYVYTPTVEYSEKEIDFKRGSARQRDDTLVQVTSLGFGYGATEYWFTELYLKRETVGSDGLTIAEWENKFQLTETGRFPVDFGVIIELEAPLNDGNAPYESRLGPLFQSEFGKLQLNGNLLFARKFARGTGPYVTEFGYQLQAKYRWQPAFEFGVQCMGETGEWNNWDRQANQNHRAGPAAFGKIPLDNRQAIKYNAAWLFGVSSTAPDHTFRMQVEYEF